MPLKKISALFVLSLLFVLPSFAITRAEYEQAIFNERSKPERILKTEKYYDENIGKYVDVVAGEILVKFKPSVSALVISSVNEQNNVRIVKTLPKAGIHLLSVSPEAPAISVKELIEKYNKEPNVEYAEPNYIRRSMITTPNDPYYSLQHALPQIMADAGWDITRGVSNAVIAIIDSGVDGNHPDLIDNIWFNSIEEAGSNWNNGIDDDGNGYIDDFWIT